jgi:hypothetical protein
MSRSTIAGGSSSGLDQQGGIDVTTTEPTAARVIDGPIISADSHITEPPNCYVDFIDPAYRDQAPYMHHDDSGDVFVIPGMSRPVAMGLVAAAGKPAEEITVRGVDFDDLHRGG